jgi:hypothetical protein
MGGTGDGGALMDRFKYYSKGALIIELIEPYGKMIIDIYMQQFYI